jgi:hypothetical protein
MFKKVKRILLDMALLRNLYNFTKYVEETEYTDGVLQFVSTHNEAYKQYAKAKGIPEKKAINIGRTAASRQYITYMPLNDLHGPPNKLAVDTAGVELTHRTMFGLLPKGLMLEWAEKNSKLINIIWLFIGVAIARIDDIIRLVRGWII